MVENVNSVIVNSVCGLKFVMITELTMSNRVKCSQSHLSIFHYYCLFWILGHFTVNDTFVLYHYRLKKLNYR